MPIADTCRPTLPRSLALMGLLACSVFSGHPQSNAPQTLDRVVATVNNHAILASDIADEMRLSVLDPNLNGVALTSGNALQQLISRSLIQQQIRTEDIPAVQPSDEEVRTRVVELRK
jgi:parvulin-like peptidyl-prolyl isomerase